MMNEKLEELLALLKSGEVDLDNYYGDNYDVYDTISQVLDQLTAGDTKDFELKQELTRAMFDKTKEGKIIWKPSSDGSYSTDINDTHYALDKRSLRIWDDKEPRLNTNYLPGSQDISTESYLLFAIVERSFHEKEIDKFKRKLEEVNAL